VAAPRGLRIWLDDYAFARLAGAAIDHDTEKETEGYLLDHPDAVLSAFC
jgi:Fe-S cluster assembly iron-binding protein IscA